MKNRAGLLALVVLAVATIFMVFVVLPKINGGKNPVADLANQASSTVKDVAKSAGDAASDVVKSANDVAASGQSAVLAKMDRLKVDATGAVAEMQSLFADGKVPTAEQIAATKAKAETALKAIVDMPLPDGLDATLSAAAKTTTETASKWLGLVQAIPSDVDGAKKAIGELAAAMGLPALAEIAKTAEPAAPAVEPAKPADTAANTAEAPKPADATPAAPAADATKPADTAAAPAANGIVPTFDIVRVEKDGSMVVAGRAAPGSKIQIMNGDTVIASTDADQDGNFVAVLDNPLAPGDYSLVLKTTDKNGVVNLSEEVATVSVPKDKTGQLLAMVTKAGEASRILTAPEAPKTAEVAAATPAAPAAGDVKVPDLPAASNTIAGSAPVVDVPAASASAETKPAADATTAPATPAAPAAETKPAAPTTPDVMVTAVELEGQKIFIAGTTKPGMLVRAYADDKLVGEIKSEANGAFVVEGKLDLAVGSHTIRADVIDDKGAVAFRATVPFDRPEGEAVAVVASNDAPAGAPAKMENLGDGKFDQLRTEAGKALGLLKDLFAGGKLPTGEQLAAGRSSLQFALASLADFKLPDGADAASATLVSKVASSAANALNLLKALPQDPAAFSAGFAAVETAVNAVISPNSDASTAAAGTSAAEPAKVAAAEPAKPAANEPAKSATTEAAKRATTEPAATTDAAPAANTAPATADATKPAATQEAVKPAGSSSAEAVKPAGEPKTTEQAPLQASKTSVIIRHGDTLWQISRRVYGRGIRYTTIYLANEDQISNPDKIAPGQVFGVPDKSVPDSDAEALHRKHLQEKK